MHKTMSWHGVIFILRVTILMFINGLNIKKNFKYDAKLFFVKNVEV